MLALPAQAATFEWWRNAEPDSYDLKITGAIVKGDSERFKLTLLTAHPGYWRSRVNFTVHLDSVGGMVVEAIDIGNTIRIFKFNTFVADGAICASACGLIWLAGDRRYFGANAALGFHTVYDPRTRQPTPTSGPNTGMAGRFARGNDAPGHRQDREEARGAGVARLYQERQP
jgi:hypothetical protein